MGRRPAAQDRRTLLHFLSTDSWLGGNTLSKVAMVAAKCFAMTSSADGDVLRQVSWLFEPSHSTLYLPNFITRSKSVHCQLNSIELQSTCITVANRHQGYKI